ncbi:hypothetical protein N0824_00463 [Microcystis sp. 0824]|nr:hypothetical protein N0824_00463 [Microcystis sp. 0824]
MADADWWLFPIIVVYDPSLGFSACHLWLLGYHTVTYP